MKLCRLEKLIQSVKKSQDIVEIYLLLNQIHYPSPCQTHPTSLLYKYRLIVYCLMLLTGLFFNK